MFRIDDPSASPTLPTPEAAGTEGFWTEGNPAGGVPATLERASWFNMIQEELRAIVVAGGLTPSKTTYNQVLAAIKSIALSQVVGVTGQAVNLRANLTAAGTSVTYTADQIVLTNQVGGINISPILVQGFNQTFDGTKTGIGGMDIGSLPVSGYVAIYAAFDPGDGAVGIFGTSASSLVGNIYSGANLPAGYTATALIGIWPTNSSGQLVIGSQFGRSLSLRPTVALNTNTAQATWTGLSISGVVPPNAKMVDGYLFANGPSGSGNMFVYAASDGSGMGNKAMSGYASSGNAVSGAFSGLALVEQQKLYYQCGQQGITSPVYEIVVGSFEF